VHVLMHVHVRVQTSTGLKETGGKPGLVGSTFSYHSLCPDTESDKWSCGIMSVHLHDVQAFVKVVSQPQAF
jgi:hypothetical protein